MVSIGLAGFLGGYMWTRLEFSGLLRSSEKESLERLQRELPELQKQLSESDRRARGLASVVADSAEPVAVDTRELAQVLSPGVASALEEFLRHDAAWESDPVADVFGSFRGRNPKGRRLSATATRMDGVRYMIEARVSSEKGDAITGDAVFLLHPTAAIASNASASSMARRSWRSSRQVPSRLGSSAMPVKLSCSSTSPHSLGSRRSSGIAERAARRPAEAGLPGAGCPACH